MGKFTASILILILCLAKAYGQDHANVLKIKGTRLVYPLMQKWIIEFNKAHPEIKVLISPDSPADSIDFSIASYALSAADLKGDLEGIVVAKYVQLPIVNAGRPDLHDLQTRGITNETLKNIFFGQQVSLKNESTPSALELYVRDRPVCAVKAFAGHFGENPSEIKGHGIKGDDSDLAEAVKRDVNGFSFNNLGFIYDLTTRKIANDLAVIPLDLNVNGKIDPEEQIYGSLDEVVNFIEKTNHPAFVNEKVNLTFHKGAQKASAKVFLRWILNDGQAYNHEYGFLLMDKSMLTEQKAIASRE